LRAEPAPNQEPPVLLPETSLGSVERIGPVTGVAMAANTHTVVRRSDRTDPNDGSGLTVLVSSLGLLDALNGKVHTGKLLGPSTQDSRHALRAASRVGRSEPAVRRACRETGVGEQFSALFLGLAGVALLVGEGGGGQHDVHPGLATASRNGLRRALGAPRGQIRSQFLTDAVASSWLGWLAGTVLGVVVVGVVAGIHPSIRAARLAPTGWTRRMRSQRG
jgi:hypothetical protein